MKKMLIIICVFWILLESYFIINNYSNDEPIAADVTLLIGFLGALYLICGKEDVVAKKTLNLLRSKKNKIIE